MAFSFDVDKAGKNEGAGDFTPEEKWIPEGDTSARLCGFVEMGLHVPTFGRDDAGKPKLAVYDKGKRMGQVKDPSFEIQLIFATNCPHTGPDPLCLLGGDYDRIKIADYMWKDPAKITNKTNLYKNIMKMRDITGINGSSFTEFINSAFTFPVINKENTNSKIEGMQYANTKLAQMKSTKVFADGAVASALNVEVGSYIGDNAKDLPEVGTEEGQFSKIIFSWDEPTEDMYKAIKPWHRKRIKDAVNFAGSPIHTILDAKPELYDLDKREDKEEEADADTQADQAAGSPKDPGLKPPPLAGAAAALLAKGVGKAGGLPEEAVNKAVDNAKDVTPKEKEGAKILPFEPDAKKDGTVAATKEDKAAILKAKLAALEADISGK